ncbi:MAG: hypothetical protein ABIG61_16530 [Planctomycetota bacterium]
MDIRKTAEFWAIFAVFAAIMVPVHAGAIIQAQQTTPVYIEGSAGAMLQVLNFDPGGVGGTTPTGQNAYILSGGAQHGYTAHKFLLPVIADGTYTVDLCYAISNIPYWTGGFSVQLIATAEAIAAGRITFVGNGSSILRCYSDDVGWVTETLVGSDNFLANMNGTPYDLVILDGMQSGDLYLYLEDEDTASYSKVSWDTIDFIDSNGVEPLDPNVIWDGNFAPMDNFDIGVYYYGRGLPDENFDWDYGLMDVARNGGTTMVVERAYNRGVQFWAAAKHWGLKGISTYAIVNEAPMTEAEMSSWILSNKNYWANLTWNSEVVGDNVVGYLIADETNCGSGIPTSSQDFIRLYCDLFKVLDPERSTYINNCYPSGWFDLHAEEATSSLYPYGTGDGGQITTGVATAAGLGLNSFGVVRQCDGHGFDKIHEQMIIAFQYGAKAFRVYTYSGSTDIHTLVDTNGLDNNYRMTGFSTAARQIRDYQGWPSVSLAHKVSPRNMPPLMDRRNYPSGNITLVAKTSQGSAPMGKVVFGKSTNGGATWETVEDTSYPYETTFSLSVGTTVILRAQAVDTTGQGSIWAANMLYIVEPSALECGDYESALLPGDINKDCRVDMADVAELVCLWLACDDPADPLCGTGKPLNWYCGKPGSGYPALAADIDDDCDIDLDDFALLANNWFGCDDPVTANCP